MEHIITYVDQAEWIGCTKNALNKPGDIFAFLRRVLGAPAIMLGVLSNTQEEKIEHIEKK